MIGEKIKIKSERTTIIHLVCKKCSFEINIKVRYKDYYDWISGRVLFPDAFPYLKQWERRMLLTDECKDCYHERIFGNTLFKMSDL